MDRITLAFLMDSYEEQMLEGGKERTVLHLHPDLAPVKVAVIPLARNKPDMVELAKRIKRDLQATAGCDRFSTTAAISESATRGRTRSERHSA